MFLDGSQIWGYTSKRSTYETKPRVNDADEADATRNWWSKDIYIVQGLNLGLISCILPLTILVNRATFQVIGNTHNPIVPFVTTPGTPTQPHSNNVSLMDTPVPLAEEALIPLQQVKCYVGDVISCSIPFQQYNNIWGTYQLTTSLHYTFNF